MLIGVVVICMQTEPMMKVNRYTRAGRKGKKIVCPVCTEIVNVYHFSWSILGCTSCHQMIDKCEWGVPAKQVSQAPL
jgi:hypothetical protein